MKSKTLAVVFVVLLAFTSFSFTSTANTAESADDSCCCRCCSTSCLRMMGVAGCEDVEVNVENVEDGVVVKFTSKNADIVKKIQEMSAKMKKMCAQKECCKKKIKIVIPFS